MLDLFAKYINQIEQGLHGWPEPLKCWRQVLIPKPGKDHSSLDNWRPISVGSAFYRVWSAVRVQQLQNKILHLAGSDVHGGIPNRGTHTALTEPLCELQRTQSLQANGIPMAQIRPALRYLGMADLTKAFDKLHSVHATASALRLGLPKQVVKAWSAAWIGQKRILQMRHSCSSFWVDSISNLPQGDPASPLGLMCCLVEALDRIKQRFPDSPEFGRTLHRMYLDDRSWFCSRQSTCLLIAKAWKTEAENLGLDESKNKAEFAVISSRPSQARKEFTEALRAANVPGQVVIRPKILGSRISTMRNAAKQVKEETERLERAKGLTKSIQRLPMSKGKKLMFAKGAAVSLVATPVLHKLPTLQALKSIQSQVTACGSNTKGFLTQLLLGHTACLNFQAGKVSALFTLLQSTENPVIRQAWSGSVCNGPVSLLRKWMQRQGWTERSRWQWSHPSSGIFLAHQGTPPIPGHRKVAISSAHKDEINHWLRDAWRSHTWNKWLTKTKNHRAHAIGHREWSNVRTAFDELGQYWKSCLQNWCLMPWPYFLDLSVVRPFSMEPVTVWNPPCWFCGCEGFADFNHQAWGCPFWAAGQPPTPQDLVQFNLGWPMTTNTQYNFQVVHHLIAVRQALAERRHALD